jgi:hypothetical protein
MMFDFNPIAAARVLFPRQLRHANTATQRVNPLVSTLHPARRQV